MDASQYAAIEVGSIVSYLLPSSEWPTNPTKRWRGKVEAVYRSKDFSQVGFCVVTLLDDGYKDLHECVLFDQIVSIE